MVEDILPLLFANPLSSRMSLMQNVLVRPDVALLSPVGHINASNAEAFKQELTAVVSTGEWDAVLVDMAQVESLDSAGLMALVASLSLANTLNRRFALCSVSPSIRIIFELTQLDRAFAMFESVAAFEAALP